MIKHWTPEEELTLIEMRTNNMPYSKIADKLGRSLEAVKSRGKRLKARGSIDGGNQGNFSWTDDEVAKLYENLDYDELAEALGKSRRSVESKCQKLGISKRFSNFSSGTMYPDKPALLYLVDFGEFKKVGVTQVQLSERFKQDGDFTILDTCTMSLEDALETEKEILKNMRDFKVVGEIRRGFSECFKFDCTLLEEII
jgi:biotin operon repressor